MGASDSVITHIKKINRTEKQNIASWSKETAEKINLIKIVKTA